jgi:flavin reductase (DIM6/NTAB) family NADH-FMN oxidoreductase RutF
MMDTMPEFHFYEPSKGHGLMHDPFKAIVAPRPIGWISTRDAEGRVNLAPYSFFNAVCDHPPMVMFSSAGWKDTVANIKATGEFVCNLVTGPPPPCRTKPANSSWRSWTQLPAGW